MIRTTRLNVVCINIPPPQHDVTCIENHKRLPRTKIMRCTLSLVKNNNYSAVRFLEKDREKLHQGHQKKSIVEFL